MRTGSTVGDSPQPGTDLGGYVLGEPLGSGGIAAVYRARHHDGREVAVKVLHPQSLGTDEVKRFQREYRALSRLRHKNIVQVYETGVRERYPWIAMELVDGRDLEAEIERWADDEPQDRWTRVERILRGLCQALDHVHEHGLVHRDIKPRNILVDESGEPRLTDFGVVKDRHAQTTALTMQGNLVGTVAFMAPEQITDEPVDPRTDLYSLGAVLYVMLTGKRPIEARSVTAFLARHLSHVPPAPGSVRPDVPRRLEAICQRLLYKDRTQRYPSARAILRALDQQSDIDAIPLRGRDRLLSAFRDRLGDVASGAPGGIIQLLGPPGSGTSASLGAAASLAAEGGLAVAMASGLGRNPVTALLRGLGGPAESEPAARHLRLLAARCRERPTVLAIDDIDAAQPKMLQAITRLAGKLVTLEQCPVLLLTTSTAPVLDGESDVQVDTWILGPVDRRAILDMLRDRGVKGRLKPVLAKRLLYELDGLPGAVHAQLQALVLEGWLAHSEGRLTPQRPIDDFATETLPVPGRARTDLERRLGQVDDEAAALIEALATFGRPASIGLLTRCTGAQAHAIDHLFRAGLVQEIRGSDGPRMTLTTPWAASVVLDRVSPGRRRKLHAAAARALGASRSRALAAEVARHYEAAGEPAKAWPLYIRAGRAAARERDPARVIDLCARAKATQLAGEAAVTPERALKLRRRQLQLEGDAHLARGNWEPAIEPLIGAVDAARADEESSGLTRSLSSLGRAWYRLGRFDEARPLLEEALSSSRRGSPERAPAVRALADILLRRGELDRAEALWHEALDTARTADSPDAEARAHRGLAHLRVLQGQLQAAGDELESAADLLRSGGPPRIRAGVLARAVELDLAAGRYSAALHRADSLIELVNARDLDERVPEAWALLALVRHRIDPTENDDEALQRARALHRPTAPDSWPVGVMLARMLAERGQVDTAAATLPRSDDLPSEDIEDAAGQVAALRARCLAASRSKQALDLARWCLVREPAPVVLRHVDICLDAGHALLAAGDASTARQAAKLGLRRLHGPGSDGLRVELLHLFLQADPDPRVRDALDQVTGRVLRAQPPSVADRLRTQEKWRTSE